MNITSFLIYCVIVTFTPGPTNVVILSIAHNYGARKSMEFAYGAVIAIGTLLTISTILNSILATIIPRYLEIIQIIGSLYILYLAYQISKMDTSEATVKQTASFLSGFLMQFVNPKVVLFTMTVIPSFVIPYYTSLLGLSIFVLVVTVIAFLALITWVFFGTIFKGFFQKRRKVVNIIMALFLVYSAIVVSGISGLLRW